MAPRPHAHSVPATLSRTEDEERAWVVGIQRGDAAAFMALFRAYQARMRAFAGRFVDSSETAQDVVQDVFLSVWQRRATWCVSESLPLYLFGAVRNRALNDARNRKGRDVPLDDVSEVEMGPVALVTDAQAGPYEQACVAELDAAVARAIAGLPERCRQTYVLRWYYHLTGPEIAHTQGVSLKTVESQITAAHKVLRTRLRRFL